MAEVSIQTIGKRVSQWGEGPIWWEGCLHYVDIKGQAIVRLDPQTGAETVWEFDEQVGTVVPTQGDAYLYAGDLGITRFDPNTGKSVRLADPEAEMRPDNRFNDGKCDPAGRFWAGTISQVKKKGSAACYMLDLDGELMEQIENVTNSNGLCWSADAKTMYYIDTPSQSVTAYDFNLFSGQISNARTCVDTAALGYTSSPDGMTIDSEGKLWVAFCHGGCVVRFDPDNGQKLQQVDFPCVETTACAFGGPNLERLFVTTGIKKDADEPEAGRVFVVDGLGVKGVPAVPYAG
jgi:sugar lactone lactonase YvrE